jgi:hypothetical protein
VNLKLQYICFGYALLMRNKNNFQTAVLTRVVAAACAFGFAAFAGCSKAPAPQPEQKQADAQPSPALSPINACALLTGEEIETILGEPLQEQTPSEKSEPGVVNGQCFFRLPTFTKSVSLSVTQGAPGGPHSSREFWKTAFSEKRVNPPEREDGRIKLPPDRLEGLGDEAFWTGGPAGGLYILKGDNVVFIGIGSSGDEGSRRESVRRLGELVVKRL